MENNITKKIDEAISGRQRTRFGIYSDMGGVLDKFDTEQLIKYFTEKYGDGLIKDYIKDKIIKAEIAKENELIWKKLDEKINLGEKAAMKKSARIKK